MKRNALRTSIAIVLSLVVAGCGLKPVPLEAPSAAPAPTTSEKSEQQTVSTQPEPVGTELEVMSDTAEEYAMVPNMYASPEDFNTEEYASVEETGFVTTATTPLSTVSADVDTASYANLRRMLRAGYKLSSTQKRDEANTTTIETTGPDDAELLDEYPEYYADAYQVIPTGAVRIEEMLNYFDYNYERPKTSDAFGMTAKVGTCPWNKDTQLLVLGFATGDEDKSVAEKGSNLVFLIDVSGSMDDPDKLPLLQSSFGELVKSLGDNDRVSIVTYASGEDVVLEGAKGSDQQQIMRAIRGLKASGSTNGEAGLKMAYELARKNFIEGGVNRIVMASDGDLNVGMTSESDLHDYVDEQRKTGVYLSVLGFGAGNYKDTKMETLADHGNGSYHYIDCEAEAERVFGERLTANLVPFADDVKMQIEFNPSTVKGYRLIGYENRTMAAEDFQNDEKDAGEVGPRSQFTVAYEVVPVDSAMELPKQELKYGTSANAASGATADELLTAKLRYKPVGSDEVKQQETVVTKSDVSNDPGEDWRFAAAVTEFGMLLRDSDFKGTSSFDSVRKLVSDNPNDLRAEFLDLVNLAEHN